MTGRIILLHGAVILALFLLQFIASDYAVLTVTRIMVLAIYALGYNILFGYAGLLSLGHAMFFATGLYAAALGVTRLGMAVPEAFLFALVSLKSPGLEFLEGSYFWEAYPRYAGAKPTEFDTFYRGKVGVDQYGSSVSDPADVSTYSHMFGCWETLYIIKQAMEAAGYKGPDDRAKLIEATEAITTIPEGNEHPQGDKVFNGKIHQVFGHQNITQVKGGVGELVYRTTIEEGLYEPEADYTKMAL